MIQPSQGLVHLTNEVVWQFVLYLTIISLTIRDCAVPPPFTVNYQGCFEKIDQYNRAREYSFFHCSSPIVIYFESIDAKADVEQTGKLINEIHQSDRHLSTSPEEMDFYTNLGHSKIISYTNIFSSSCMLTKRMPYEKANAQRNARWRIDSYVELTFL